MANASKNDQMTLLLVDDDKVGSKLLGERLAKNSFNVHYNYTGENVLEDIALTKPDAVLLDIVFPGVSGMDVLKMIRLKHSAVELPVIMVTSKHLSGDIVDALDSGASDFITKPANLKVSLARINTHIQNKELNAKLVKKSSEDTVSAMIATYNHEINNPLAVIFGKVELLGMQSDSAYIGDIKKASMRIKDIVSKMARLAEDGDLELKKYADSIDMVDLK